MISVYGGKLVEHAPAVIIWQEETEKAGHEVGKEKFSTNKS